jgi:hypothetical protein
VYAPIDDDNADSKLSKFGPPPELANPRLVEYDGE